MINRRQFIASSAAAAVSLTACKRESPRQENAPASPQPNPPRPPGKKGIGIATKDPRWAQHLSALRCKWFYSWNSAIPDGVPAGVKFIPMIYRYKGKKENITTAAAAAKAAGIAELLGFNEPDVKKQGNMTMDEALDAWPLLMETGMRLGSPSCVHPDKEWMTEFMTGVKKRGLRVDFVCVHSYGGPSPEALVKRLENIHRMFGCPIWITEFAVGDWEAKSVAENRHKPEKVLGFMEKVLPMLEKLDFLERYAWFPAKTTDTPLCTSALFDEDGSLTRLGECYRDV